ncbi:FtsH protease activity modulator HflK [Castellaniella denitrificans]|uniref:Protein HflK n=1 Tax=Castellaniella denitrificans TaxID=56119 RepID=A0ABT4M545_9BURK|nr:FtsH protease activity modulator HflK [Castellaniella denitrificans]MCZ4330415.1 FtsH protease activity modulator HflK [Castellaniella denitrificans]
MRAMKLFNLNDPGWGRGNQNQNDDPRGKPDQSSGPPDLDEVWRDFSKRLNGLFGRRGGGRGPRPPSGGGMPSLPGPSLRFVLLLIVAAGLLWLASGFMIVQEGQVAVVTRFGQYVKTLNPGLQWRLPYPIEASQPVNISQLRTFEVGFRGSSRNKVLSESLMLTNDENIVDVQFVVQYRLLPDGAPAYLFNTNQPDESVRQAAETAMREIVGRKPMDFVLYSGRTEVASEVQALAQSILDRYKTGIQISTVAIQNVQPPEQVQAAFDDAVKAGQDRERQINEGNAYASKVLPEAEGQAARMIQESEGYSAKVIGQAQGDTSRFDSIATEYAKAPGVTRERLYLETMQEILSDSAKVMIDAPVGNNMLYLPLDKIMGQAAHAAGGAPSPGSRDTGPSGGSAPAAAGSAQAAQGQSGSGRASQRGVPSGLDSLMTSPYSN